MSQFNTITDLNTYLSDKLKIVKLNEKNVELHKELLIFIDMKKININSKFNKIYKYIYPAEYDNDQKEYLHNLYFHFDYIDSDPEVLLAKKYFIIRFLLKKELIEYLLHPDYIYKFIHKYGIENIEQYLN
jgi:hypothetical protein